MSGWQFLAGAHNQIACCIIMATYLPPVATIPAAPRIDHLACKRKITWAFAVSFARLSASFFCLAWRCLMSSRSFTSLRSYSLKRSFAASSSFWIFPCSFLSVSYLLPSGSLDLQQHCLVRNCTSMCGAQCMMIWTSWHILMVFLHICRAWLCKSDQVQQNQTCRLPSKGEISREKIIMSVAMQLARGSTMWGSYW